VSPFASDPVVAVLSTALDGVALRQSVIANNIANVDTPGFRAGSVDFETSLKAAISDGSLFSGQPGAVPITATPTQTPVGANNNNVDLRKETMAALQSTFQYQMLSRATTDHFATIRTAAEAF
jgi:flagellar basal-body rod protein FlgB